jgi:hypothetical protein
VCVAGAPWIAGGGRWGQAVNLSGLSLLFLEFLLMCGEGSLAPLGGLTAEEDK